MKHPEEHTLELYVLNAAAVAPRRAEIEEHVKSCAGCKSLVGEMSAYYSELDQELQKPKAPVSTTVERQLAKRNSDLAIWEDRLATSPTTGWTAPVKTIRYYIRRYPMATAGTTFAFAALAGIGSLMGYREVTKDLDPAYAELNKLSGHLEVYNRGNDLLWKRIVRGIDTTLDMQNISGNPRYAVFDIDADGRKEVLTTLEMTGEPVMPKLGLHIIDGSGNNRELLFSRTISFRGTPYEIPITLEAGSLFVIDSTDPAHPEILVTVKNDRSPNAIVRMNAQGDVIGEYWHHGQVRSLYLHDLDGDGRRELLFCGTNDVDDNIGPAIPVIGVLDPQKLVGRRESRLARGYGYGESDAELYYVAFPLTEVNTYTHSAAGVDRIRLEHDRILIHWTSREGESNMYALEFVLSLSLEPLRTLSTTQTKELFDREYAAKHISTRLDDAYLEALRSQIRFWDGEGWSAKAVRVSHTHTAPEL